MERWQRDDVDEPAADDEEDLEGEWELDPNDPSHPDYDLSIAAGYGGWEPAPKPWLTRRGVMLLVAVLVILGLVIIPLIAQLS